MVLPIVFPLLSLVHDVCIYSLAPVCLEYNKQPILELWKMGQDGCSELHEQVRQQKDAECGCQIPLTNRLVI